MGLRSQRLRKRESAECPVKGRVSLAWLADEQHINFAPGQREELASCITLNEPGKSVKVVRSTRMEVAIRIQIEELPEGLFLATSEELPGLVAQGRTVAETLEIARDVARKLIEARRERGGAPHSPPTSETRDYTIVVAA